MVTVARGGPEGRGRGEALGVGEVRSMTTRPPLRVEGGGELGLGFLSGGCGNSILSFLVEGERGSVSSIILFRAGWIPLEDSVLEFEYRGWVEVSAGQSFSLVIRFLVRWVPSELSVPPLGFALLLSFMLRIILSALNGGTGKEEGLVASRYVCRAPFLGLCSYASSHWSYLLTGKASLTF